MSDVHLDPGEWSWPVQIKILGDEVVIRPMHLMSRMAGEFVADTEPTELFSILLEAGKEHPVRRHEVDDDE